MLNEIKLIMEVVFHPATLDIDQHISDTENQNKQIMDIIDILIILID